jgi:hypothetical protein
VAAATVSAAHGSLLPFLRRTALLCLGCGGWTPCAAHEAYAGLEVDAETEVAALTAALGLPSPADLARAWTVRGDLYTIAAGWVRPAVLARGRRPRSHAQVLMWMQAVCHPAAPLRLTRPPELFQDLFRTHAQLKCRRCKTTPRDPALCLLCGDVLCMGSSCCIGGDGRAECARHTLDCGGGACVFLLVRSSSILVHRERRRSLCFSVYLDAHGEEDIDLRRGKPLTLSALRFYRIEEIYLDHLADMDTQVLQRAVGDGARF